MSRLDGNAHADEGAKTTKGVCWFFVCRVMRPKIKSLHCTPVRTFRVQPIGRLARSWHRPLEREKIMGFPPYLPIDLEWSVHPSIGTLPNSVWSVDRLQLAGVRTDDYRRPSARHCLVESFLVSREKCLWSLLQTIIFIV